MFEIQSYWAAIINEAKKFTNDLGFSQMNCLLKKLHVVSVCYRPMYFRLCVFGRLWIYKHQNVSRQGLFILEVWDLEKKLRSEYIWNIMRDLDLKNRSNLFIRP